MAATSDPPPGSVTALTFAPDGQSVAWVAADGTVRQARTADGTLIRILDGVGGPIRAAAFSADGARLAGGTANGMVHLWDVR